MDPKVERAVSKYLENRRNTRGLKYCTNEEIALIPSEVLEQYPPFDVDYVMYRLTDELKEKLKMFRGRRRRHVSLA